MNILKQIPPNLRNLEQFDGIKSPKQLFYKGDISLLDEPLKIAIVGTRNPNQYTKHLTATLSSLLAQNGAVIVSGGALGIDIIAHKNAYENGRLRAIMFSPSSLDIIYPRENRNMIEQISKSALIISEYEKNYIPHRFSFLERNRLVIGLSDIVIIPQADLRSGSMNSANLALQMKKRLFVLPHRLPESRGTQSLLEKNLAQCIYDVQRFVDSVCLEQFSESRAKISESSEVCDEVLEFCKKSPSLQSAIEKFGDRIFEYEISGKIVRENGLVRVIC